jgi:hypothetical protein
MEDETPFFTKSKERFETSTIEAWGMLTRHLRALKNLSAKDMPDKKYKRLWDYENYLIRTIAQLEKIPCFQVLMEEENPLNLETFCKQEPYEGPCRTKELKIITVGDFGSTLQSSSSSSGEQ